MPVDDFANPSLIDSKVGSYFMLCHSTFDHLANFVRHL